MRCWGAAGSVLSLSRDGGRGRDRKAEVRGEKNALPEDMSGDNRTMMV